VMQSARSSLPKLKPFRMQVVAAPMFRSWYFLFAVLFLKFLQSFFQESSALYNLALRRSPGANLTQPGSAMKIFIRFSRINFFYLAFYPDLTFQFRPIK